MFTRVHQRRFEDALKKLQGDLDIKLAQKDELEEQMRLRKEPGSGVPQDLFSEPNEGANNEGAVGDG